MNIIRLTSGKIFFDEFDESVLKTEWKLIPDDNSRYSLVERPGFINIYHGIPNFMMLCDEPSSYILDVKNEYLPNNDLIQAGVIVYSSEEEKLEVLEYFDVAKSSAFVYNYIRVEKSDYIYTIYGKNLIDTPWEFIGAVRFNSSAKVGLLVKGPQTGNAPDFSVDYFRMYKSKKIQILNVKQGYLAEIYDQNNMLIQSVQVYNPNNGAEFNIDELMPFTGYFKIFDEELNVVSTSGIMEICGGDIFYHGLYLDVLIDGKSLKPEGEHFLGYFSKNEINFTVEVVNRFSQEFGQVTISAVPYLDDTSNEQVYFSLTQDGEYVSTLNIGNILPNQDILLFGKIIRDADRLPLDIEPCKFNIQLGSV
jgi:hypothetical protein